MSIDTLTLLITLLKDDRISNDKRTTRPFISNLKSEEDKQLMSNMLSNSYHKYNNSIKAKSGLDIELMLSTKMALLIGQSNEIERLGLLTKTTQND